MKVRPQKGVVWVERTPSGPFLCVSRGAGKVDRINLQNAGALILGARYKVLLGDPMTVTTTGVVGSEPEWHE